MTYRLAIYDLARLGSGTKGATLPKPKLITLAETHSDTPSDSQGLPRLLDGITLSPMAAKPGSPRAVEFRPPFQFQSTVFPAVSIIDLDEEKERVDERKQLFCRSTCPASATAADRLQPVRGALRRRRQAGLPDPGGLGGSAGIRPVAQRQAEQQPPPPQEVPGAPRRPSSFATCRARIRGTCL